MKPHICLLLFLYATAAFFWNASASTSQEIDSLIDQLNDQSGEVRYNAFLNLIRIGKPAVPQLLKALPAAGRHLRHEIVDIFTQMESDAEEAVPALLAELREPNFSVPFHHVNTDYHWDVTVALASIGPSALAGLTEALSDPNRNVRQYAASALDYMGIDARTSVPALMPLLQDKYGKVRAAAASALGSMGQVGLDTLFELHSRHIPPPDALRRSDHPAHAAVSSLIQLLADESDSVRTAAAGALGAIADPTAVPALIAALKDTHPDVRANAATALGAIGAPAKAAVPVLINRSKIVMNRELESIIRGLGGIGTPDVVPVLTEALTDSSALIRLTAAGALADAADPTAVPALIAALKDKDNDVRAAAAIALGAIGAPAKAAVPVLIDMLEQAGCIEGGCIIQGLGGIGTPDVVPVLIDALNNESGQIRYMAEIELRKLKGDK